MDWPSHFPPECPPPESADANGDVYRIVNGKKPAEGDFVSYWFLKPQMRARALEAGNTDKACQLCGLSVYLTLADIERLQRRVRHLGKGQIAVGHLNGEGKLLDTGDGGHHTWWISRQLEKPWESFKVVA